MRPASLSSLLVALAIGASDAQSADYTLIGWNDLGMHCTDGSDFSVFSILPHYNTIHAQLVRDGRLVTSPAGIQVTYQAVADATGSINRTSIGKGNFWEHVGVLYGADLVLDMGLAGFAMPGSQNNPQAMSFDPGLDQFMAEGIPITPYDDTGAKNYYPMMRLVARDGGGQLLASTDIVLPVSDEMDCRVCHASGAVPDTEPAAGWVWDCDSNRDYKLNILRGHDEVNAGARYQELLAEAGYDAGGLYATVTQKGQPVLCARCHTSNALPGTGIEGVMSLTRVMHLWHAWMNDPDTGLRLKDLEDSAACYRCHPGQETRCLRGAMGAAVAEDGSMAMQCQSCHGSMLDVGAAGRTGWLDQPNCQSCHTGTAVANNGQIRYLSAFEPDGTPRQAVNQTFATQPNTPEEGFSLYRFSKGHGGLQCEACHGSTHAEYPSTHPNDNVQSQQLQGHAGLVGDCTVCHEEQPETVTGGPHGMHPVGNFWIDHHKDAAEHNAGQCRTCHGLDYRGTVLSRSLGDRTVSAFGTKTFWRGFQIGCYTCHRGPSSDDRNRNNPPVVSMKSVGTRTGQPVDVILTATDADGDNLELRVVQQPAHGTVALAGTRATYRPDSTFAGVETFTYAAWDGSTDSNLGRVTVSVSGGDCILAPVAWAPAETDLGRPAPFRSQAGLTGCAEGAVHRWTFDDGTEQEGAEVRHTFQTAGEHQWTLRVTAGDVEQVLSGLVSVKPGADTVMVELQRAPDGSMTMSWAADGDDFHVEVADKIGPDANWQPVLGDPVANGAVLEMTIQPAGPTSFFRLRKGP